MPAGISTSEILVVLLVAVVMFGEKLPDVAGKLGRMLSEFLRG